MSRLSKKNVKLVYGLRDQGLEGSTLYVSPKPYPVPCPAYDYGSNVIYMNGRFLDWGKSSGTVFPWQMLIGMPLGFIFISAVFIPFAMIVMGALSGDLSSSVNLAIRAFDFWILVGGGMALLVFLFIAKVIFSSIRQQAKYVPIRFNRQRREVCFVQEGRTDPIFSDWEDVKAWVGDYASASQYGIMKHYSLGFSFKDKRSGEEYDMELSAMGLPMALGSWELIRSFMDYEIDSLTDVGDRADVNADGGVEGIAFFKAKRDRLHERFKKREVGLFYFIGWYLYHVSTFWMVPNRLAEWEVKEVERLKEDNVPEEMERWSAPLPESSWTLPSKEFLAESNEVRSIFSRNPGLPMYEVFDAVHHQMSKRLQQG